jgi:hypothetical protein
VKQYKCGTLGNLFAREDRCPWNDAKPGDLPAMHMQNLHVFFRFAFRREKQTRAAIFLSPRNRVICGGSFFERNRRFIFGFYQRRNVK